MKLEYKDESLLTENIRKLYEFVKDHESEAYVKYAMVDPWHIFILVDDATQNIIDNHLVEFIRFETDAWGKNFFVRISGTYDEENKDMYSYEMEVKTEKDFEVARNFLASFFRGLCANVDEFYTYKFFNGMISPNRDMFKLRNVNA